MTSTITTTTFFLRRCWTRICDRNWSICKMNLPPPGNIQGSLPVYSTEKMRFTVPNLTCR